MLPSATSRILCEVCHYPVDAPSGPCPECGHPIEASLKAVGERGVPLTESQVSRVRRGAELIVLLVLLLCAVFAMRIANEWLRTPVIALGSAMCIGLILVGFGAAMRVLQRPWLIALGFAVIGLLTVAWTATVNVRGVSVAVGPAIIYAAALIPALFGAMLVTMAPVLTQVLAPAGSSGRQPSPAAARPDRRTSQVRAHRASVAPPVGRNGWGLIGLSALGLILRVGEYPAERTASGFIVLFNIIAILHVTTLMVHVAIRLRRAVPAAE